MSEKGYGFAFTRGLNLTTINETTDQEKAEFWADKMAWRPGKMAYPLTAYSFLIQNRPDMLKYHMRQMQFLHAVPANGEIPMAITMLTMLHWYACNRVPGDVMVQNGAKHAWENRGSEPCMICFVVLGTPRRTAGQS